MHKLSNWIAGVMALAGLLIVCAGAWLLMKGGNYAGEVIFGGLFVIFFTWIVCAAGEE